MTPICTSMAIAVPATTKVQFEKFTHIENALNSIRSTAEKVAGMIKDFFAKAIHYISNAFSDTYQAIHARLYTVQNHEEPVVLTTNLVTEQPVSQEEAATLSPEIEQSALDQPEFCSDIIEVDEADVEDLEESSPVVESSKAWISVSKAVMMAALLAIVGAGVLYSGMLLSTESVANPS